MEFKDKLAAQRKQNNYSQEQLADMVGISRQSVSKWETGESYPDMAKIIQLCKILNCELTDLLDDGVLSESNLSNSSKDSQTKGKQLIDYFNGFLDFVTKTYNMFIHMTFKSKIVMLIELSLLVLFIVLVVAAASAAFTSLLNPLLYLVPDSVYYVVRRIVVNIIISIFSVIGLIVFVHIFKIRYLDYYVTITDNKVKSQSVEEPVDDNINSSALVKSTSPKIVIRDPEHSSSKFIEFLANIVIVLFKILVVLCAIPAIATFVVMVGAFGLSLVNITSGNGMVFLYASMVFVGCATLCYLLIHFAYNVISSRKQPLKLFLVVLICSLVIAGIGSGLVTNKLSTFTSEAKRFKNETITIEEINEPISLLFWTSEVEYVIKDDVKGILIEATVPEEYNVVLSCWDSEADALTGESTGTIYNVYSYLYYNGPFEALGSVVRHLKEGSVIDFSEPQNVGKAKVTLSKETLNNLKHYIQ